MRLRRNAIASVSHHSNASTNWQAALDAANDMTGSGDLVIIITDGIAPRPDPPRNRRTRVLWLFHHEDTYRRMHAALRHVGQAVYIKPDPAGGRGRSG